MGFLLFVLVCVGGGWSPLKSLVGPFFFLLFLLFALTQPLAACQHRTILAHPPAPATLSSALKLERVIDSHSTARFWSFVLLSDQFFSSFFFQIFIILIWLSHPLSYAFSLSLSLSLCFISFFISFELNLFRLIPKSRCMKEMMWMRVINGLECDL